MVCLSHITDTINLDFFEGLIPYLKAFSINGINNPGLIVCLSIFSNLVSI